MPEIHMAVVEDTIRGAMKADMAAVDIAAVGVDIAAVEAAADMEEAVADTVRKREGEIM
jgi:hypothetical protein